MFYDLNVPWSANDTQLPRTLAFLHELGYNVVALNHNISGRLPADLTCPIPNPLPFKEVPSNLTILRRCTLTLTESYQNARLASLSSNYDILALRPVDERTLQLACTSLDCDIISLDLTQRLPYYLQTKHKILSEAIKAGKKLEICYASAILGDSGQRRNLISNATQLIRACRGRGLVFSSGGGAAGGVGCRGPWDVVNLAQVWGLGAERGVEGVREECRKVVVGAKLKRTGYRGVVDIVYGGEKPAVAENSKKDEAAKSKGKQPSVNGLKRKAEAVDVGEEIDASVEKPVSKRQLKKQKRAAVQAAEKQRDASGGAENETATAAESATLDKM